jgi:hypothetical protein
MAMIDMTLGIYNINPFIQFLVQISIQSKSRDHHTSASGIWNRSSLMSKPLWQNFRPIMPQMDGGWWHHRPKSQIPVSQRLAGIFIRGLSDLLMDFDLTCKTQQISILQSTSL